MAAAIIDDNDNDNTDYEIRDVWAHNLEIEFKTICRAVQKYHYVAIDTVFPGIVARPMGEFESYADQQYQTQRCNINLLRIIQLGLTFFDDTGKTPRGVCSWQFNFKFNLEEDMYAQATIDFLIKSGFQFKKHEDEGIEPVDFAELLMTSGVVLMDNIKWLSFHSRYDFGWLIKLLTNNPLPEDKDEFFELLKTYCPTIYDVKYQMKSRKCLIGGLHKSAKQLHVEQIGPQHQAGSDSLLAGKVFFHLKKTSFGSSIDEFKLSGHSYDLGTSFAVNETSNNPAPDNEANIDLSIPNLTLN